MMFQPAERVLALRFQIADLRFQADQGVGNGTVTLSRGGFGGLLGCQRRQKIPGGRDHLLGDDLGVVRRMRPGRQNGQFRKQNES